MAIDYVTGVLAAAISTRKRIDYKVGMKGIAKKATILLIVAMGHLADEVLGTNMVMMAITYAYLANEGLSIIENAEVAGVPVPNVVKMAYQTIGDKGNINLGGGASGAKKS
jgi:toxin secretion/phage lysis holin